MKNMFSFCTNYFFKHKRMMVGYILLCIFSSFFSLATPYMTGSFIDKLITLQDRSFLFTYCVVFVAINLGSILIGYLINALYIRLQTNMGYELNRDVIIHIQSTSLTYSQKQDSSELNQRINNDSNNVIIFCISVIQNIIINILILVIPLILLFRFSRIITIFLILMVIIYVISYKKIKNPLYKIGFNFKQNQSYFFSKLFEQLFNIKFIKLHSIGTPFLLRLDQAFKKVMDSAIKFQKISYLFSTLDNLILTLSQIILFVVGGLEVINKQLSIGQFTIITSYFNLIMTATRYFFNLGKSIQDNLISYNRINDILKVSKETTGTRQLESINQIDIKDLSFSYFDLCIIRRFTASFTKGKIYMLNGPNGSGKSTFVNLILGNYIDEYQGKIMYNGTPIEQLDLGMIRSKLVGVTEQEPVLIGDTIRYNILFNDEPIDENKILPLIKILSLDGFFSKLPDKYNSIINEKSSNLSGGEKQKISLLRLFYKNPDLMILDEPTSAMDNLSKDKLKVYLQSIKKDKIIILISHDETFIDIADETLYINRSVV